MCRKRTKNGSQRGRRSAAAQQAKRPLRRQEGTGHLDEAFRPLYPEEPEEVQVESKFLSPEEIEELGSRMDNLLAHMRTNMPMETVKQKGHMFFRHGLEFTREWGNLTWFTEQAIESTHAAYARQARRYKMVDNRRQIFMLKYWFSQCLLEASRPRPDDAEEYEFWDDPAFFYDDATDE
ncbi:hypothetical protein DdX_14883 [Ditylenchus destructor]|uniref:Uncharacterized protein n=1 Tax=Ditylenchus destructor TaxID=166010 RepID=A0AAD4MTQ8_9BILA|nr:hypothetical protein DdX_14883 [Ditylenchus destructor]